MTLEPKTPEQLAAMRSAGAKMLKARSSLLDRASAGQITFKAMLHERHATVLGGIKVGRLVKAMPGWGPKRCHTLLAEIGIEPERRWRALGSNQRAAIIEALTAK